MPIEDLVQEGSRCYIVLLVGRDRSDPLILQVKEADAEALLVPGATVYSRICGATLARAHARWGDRVAIASCLGTSDTFDRSIADFAAAYADQNERDYVAFVEAVRSGCLVGRSDL